jgi:Alkylmercury lyase
MSANPPRSSAAPDGLTAWLARLGLPATGVQGRQDALPGSLRAFHRALLGAFLVEAGPPDPTVAGRLAAELELDPPAALAALAAADLVHADPAGGRVRVAYPFSGTPTAHRVELADRPPVYAMCALDALGIPQMARRHGRIRSADPTGGQPITVQVDRHGWRWRPATTVILVGAATAGDACGSVADCCCPHINFHASPDDADRYRRAHPAMAAVLLGQAEAVAAAGRIFGDLLDPEPGHDPARSPSTGQRRPTTRDT